MTQRPTFRQISVLPGVWPSADLLAALEPLSQAPPLALAEWPPAGPAEQAFHRTDALLAGWKDVLDAELLGRLPALRYLGLRATTTGRVDLAYTERHGITVAPIYGYGDAGTVEFVVEQLLAHARHGLKGPHPGELTGKRLGLVGYGPVARSVGRVGLALGMEVAFHTPTPRSTGAAEPRWAPLAEVLGGSDFLSFHSPAYRHVVTPAELALVPATALVVVTTLGLPMAEPALRQWQSQRAGRIVLDLCAAHAAAEETLRLPGVEVHDLYAARTTESIKRAEAQLVENLTAALPRP
ncbi:hypothetical protein OG500_34800 [Kitasatospora sp. NBC_01250]|uniref:NAD(P)-dependent oxidoreductase n=1 Tax=Kitasatospora sp. NBC_01250 TaxID=2903571 RepID=UPI002E345A8D|nr:NAD(P)-dependent oxidoreductase [Kitasatospora sp. NBC_01250]